MLGASLATADMSGVRRDLEHKFTSALPSMSACTAAV